MRISPLLNAPNFKRRLEAKKADGVLRETKRAYPSFAPNYAHFYYLCLDKDSKRYAQALPLYKKLVDKHETLVRKPFCVDGVSHQEVIENVKKYHLGQCWENMLCAISVLQEKGYSAYPVSLGVHMRLINKTTGETEREKVTSLDHDLVLTDLGDKSKKYLRDFHFIDPWLDFSGSHSEAVARYKTAFKYNLLKEKHEFLQPLPEHPENYRYEATIGFFKLKLQKAGENENKPS